MRSAPAAVAAPAPAPAPKARPRVRVGPPPPDTSVTVIRGTEVGKETPKRRLTKHPRKVERIRQASESTTMLSITRIVISTLACC